MPTYITKPKPDEDFYVGWSTVVDAPTYWGTREQVRQDLAFMGPGAADAERFERADKTGTSAMYGDGQWSWSKFYIREVIPYRNGFFGYIRRENLRELCGRLERDESVDELIEWEPEQ